MTLRSPKSWLTFLSALWAVLAMGLAASTVRAAEGTPTPAPAPSSTPAPTPFAGATYEVQPGDTLTSIAYRFGVDLDALVQANHLSDPNHLQPGQTLALPGFEGVQGALTAVTVGYGETLTTLSRRYRVPLRTLERLNHLVNPESVVVGQSLVVPATATEQAPLARVQVRAGEPLALTAARAGVNPWLLVLANDLPGTWAAPPEAVLAYPAQEQQANAEAPGALPPGVLAVTLNPTVWVQGRTAVLQVRLRPGAAVTLGGAWDGHPLHFFPLDEGKSTWVALQGVPALQKPGLYSLELILTTPAGETFRFEQRLRVRAGNYPHENLIVPANLVDPALSKREEEQLRALTSKATPTRYWEGRFQAPSPYADCFTSRFGNRRNYNQGAYFGYHTGLDFCGGTGTPITAPADGVVVFAGPLEVHGNATIIDHGWGVYTLYAHQQRIAVQVGQRVHAGEVIGYVGATGRVTGAHLHWEVRVNGIPVDPEEWLTRTFP